jgi:hypothetical protein
MKVNGVDVTAELFRDVGASAGAVFRNRPQLCDGVNPVQQKI